MPTLCVVLPPADRAQLVDVVANGNTPQKLAVRAQILVMLADRVRPSHVAARLALSRNHVHYWVRRYVAQGVSGVLHDAPRPGRRKRITPEQVATIVNATLTTKPPAATQWSTRTMARAQHVSEKTIRNIWHQHGLQPHRVTRFKLSKDPHFVDKLRDVVGLYLNPPDKAVVFCIDEKSGIQALDRTRPVLPLRPRIPERQTHDYIRHGTTCLYAALRVLDGTVFGTCRPKRDTKEFVRFLDRVEQVTPADEAIHVILDNLSTHKSPPVQRWLRRHPRVHFHFIPTSSSWLNLVERWFGEITRDRIRRGTFDSVAVLVAAIEDYLRHYNEAPRRFIWTKDADMILDKIARCPKPLNA
ncbi:MAG: DDE endonuclease [Acidobacteria bacterium RIFCSPLOWO2_12_FULL_65_11]|nr:MAG: DDE endonuclease [Acidobacteria bacterium RIFCSPLOWO2_02_FULL_64_15]OFW31633.1 MAG: DDE endonuclease [Acidobacteria bacterium RIFCSPLOWO2_12_FULL_65_11]